jgi:predicted negative regulator of RcsB-dependent stress response
MLRAACIILLVSLPPAFGQHATSAVDTNPSGNSGQGAYGEETGTATNTRNPTRVMRGAQMVRPIILSGSVVLASGERPAEPVMIKLVCGSRVTPEGFTDSKGKFSFRIGGDTSIAAIMDASVGNSRPDDLVMGNTPTSIGLVTVDPSSGVDLSGCTLAVDAPGYRSDPIMLTRFHAMERSDVGQFILTPLGGNVASAVSVTSLDAPKEAQKAYEKATKEVRKGDSAQIEKVISELEKAVAVYPQYAAALTLLGQAKFQTGDIAGAEQALESAIDADPRFIRPYGPLILLRIGQKDWRRVAVLADFVLSFDPANVNIRWFQTVAFYELGNLDEAAAAIDKLQSDQQSAAMYPQLHHMRGLIYAQRGNFEGAAAEYKEYLELAPNSVARDTIKQQLEEWQTLGVL